jgi:hypothetical protein
MMQDISQHLVYEDECSANYNLAVYALYICTKKFMCHPNASLPEKQFKSRVESHFTR